MISEEIKKAVKQTVIDTMGDLEMSDFLVAVPDFPEHGDYFTNAALVLAHPLKKNPLEIAAILAERLKKHVNLFSSVKTVPPGFINFWLSDEILAADFLKILKEKEKYGRGKKSAKGGSASGGKNKRIQIEFVSANPTGPITLGNGRGAFWGDTLANVLVFSGFNVSREYFINDAKSSSQIKELGKTALGRGMMYLSPYNKSKIQSDSFRQAIKKLKDKNPLNLEGEAGHLLAAEIQKDNELVLEKSLGVRFDKFFSEESLYKKGLVKKIQKMLQAKKMIYEKDGAWWFKASCFGDSEDRVFIRSNGEPTYVLPDLAYHWDKFKIRKFDKTVDVWGADHYGYAPRLKAAIEALGMKPEKLTIVIMQLVRLVKDGKEVKMSKRTGEFITLEELVEEVGLDAARFFFLTHSPDTHMDFDMDLAKERSVKNPVYYVQYAYVRCGSILAKFQIPKSKFQTNSKAQIIKLLSTDEERRLIKKLIRFTEIVEETAKDYQLQRLPNYALELARLFHNFYEKHRVITDNEELTKARTALVAAAQVVLGSLLDLMGIGKPERM